MVDKDIAQIADLYTRYMKRFEMVTIMTVEEVRHNFLSGRGKGEIGDGGPGRRKEQVTWAYVVEVRITSFTESIASC
jgi:glycylpeptide N-tetradecanoyltransferase